MADVVWQMFSRCWRISLANQCVDFGLNCLRKSGNTLSIPGAFLLSISVKAASISSVEYGMETFDVCWLHRKFRMYCLPTLRFCSWETVPSALFTNWVAISSGVIGKIFFDFCDRPHSLFSVFHAFLLDFVKLIELSFSSQISRRFSSSESSNRFPVSLLPVLLNSSQSSRLLSVHLLESISLQPWSVVLWSGRNLLVSVGFV